MVVKTQLSHTLLEKGSQNILHTNRCPKEEFSRMNQNATQDWLALRKKSLNL